MVGSPGDPLLGRVLWPQKLTLLSTLSPSVLLLSAVPGLCSGRAGLSVSVQGDLQVSGPGGLRWVGRAVPGQPPRSLCPLFPQL